MKLSSRNTYFLLFVGTIYSLLALLSLDKCFFWDNIYYTAIKGDWFYTALNSIKTDSFGSLFLKMELFPPLMGIMTGSLWKLFGRELWVSHVFIFIWAIILIYNSWKLIKFFFSEKLAGWVLLITLTEATLLAQFSIAGLDIILFTGFVISIRAIFEQKKWLLAFGLFFLCLIHIRGFFTGLILLVADFYYLFLMSEKKLSVKSISKNLLPYLPAFLIIFIYVSFYYFVYNNPKVSSPILGGFYAIPNGFERIVKHFLEFGLRSVENGRIIIWVIGIFITYKGIKSKSNLTPETKLLLLFFILITGLYLLFVFTTQMPFAARYFIPQFFVLTILSIIELSKYINEKKLKLVFLLILCFELTGHLWIYPEKIAKSWDCTLAYFPYYNLRKQCFNYIDKSNLNYNDISAGFCLSGDRRLIELTKESQVIGDEPTKKYFIYSNISNVQDEFLEKLKNTQLWSPIKTFKNGFIHITIYKNLNYIK